MKDNNYINIQGWMINKLGLGGNELLLFAIIYGFSQDGESEYRGSLTYMENALQVSRNTVITAIKRLVAKGYIKKVKNNTGNLYSANISLVQKLHQASAEIELVSSAKTEHNNNIYNNKDKNKVTYQTYLKELTKDDIDSFTKSYNCNSKQVEEKAEAILLYCEGHGKKYRNYRAALQNWLLRDYGKRQKDPLLV